MSFSADRRPPERHERAARSTARLLATGLFVVVVGAVVAFSVYTVRREAVAPGAGAAAPGVAATPPGGVGPLAGTELGPYLETSRGALAAATGEVVAVVSLTSYRTEAEARKVVGDLPVLSLLVALPGRPPGATADAGRWIDDQAAVERAERDEMAMLIPTVDDPAFKEFYAEEVGRLDRALELPRPEVVFAVAVRAPAPRLQALRSDADVRLVDVGPADLGADPELRGLRPEETRTAGEPATRPL